MARVSQTTQRIALTGLAPDLTAPPADGDIIDTGLVFLYAENVGAAARVVTIQSPLTVDGLNVEELEVSVAAGQVKLIGPLPRRTFGRPAGEADAGKAYVDYDTPADWARAVVSF